METIERTIEPIFNTLCIFYKKSNGSVYILRVREKNILFPLYDLIEFEGRFSDLYSGDDELKVKEILLKSLGIEPF